MNELQTPGASAHPGFFYGKRHGTTITSARTVLRHLFPTFHPRSVVDFGCGVGTWLNACLELGAEEVLGVDGDHVPTADLVIPPQNFLASDFTAPPTLKHRYDLVICLEVAEHIPAPGARSFIETLVRAGPVVLFSAAIPGQGGYLHVNEQWPGYWRALFTDLGYRMVDCLRPLLWDNPEVLWWYRQNIMLFVEPAALERWRSPLLEGRADLQGLPLVHPELLRLRVGPPPINGSTALRILCSAILNRLRLARGRPDAGSGSVS